MHATHSSDTVTVVKGGTPQTPRTSTPSAALWRCALAAPTAAMASLMPGATVVALLAALREALAASRSAALRDALLALLAPGEALVALLPAARATRLLAALREALAATPIGAMALRRCDQPPFLGITAHSKLEGCGWTFPEEAPSAALWPWTGLRGAADGLPPPAGRGCCAAQRGRE